jgi:hypothetical protein
VSAAALRAAALPVEVRSASPAAAASRIVSIAVRGMLAAGIAGWLLGGAGTRLLESALPLQRTVFAAMLPEFDIHGFKLDRRGAQWKLQAMAVNRRYIVMHGKAVRPGLVFDVETPVRTPLLMVALIIGVLVIRAPWSRAGLVRALLIGLPGVAAALLLMPPTILSGQAWGLGMRALQEPSLPAVWVALSQFLLHGGGIALCAAVVWLGSASGRGQATPAAA